MAAPMTPATGILTAEAAEAGVETAPDGEATGLEVVGLPLGAAGAGGGVEPAGGAAGAVAVATAVPAEVETG